jgi:phosphoribosyl-ATP pyrophosphohydrolase
MDRQMSELIGSLAAAIADRKANPTQESYTARLIAAGTARIAQKVGEEAVEVVVAALEESDERLVSEMADLIYHSLVLLEQRELSWSDVEAELARRFK